MTTFPSRSAAVKPPLSGGEEKSSEYASPTAPASTPLSSEGSTASWAASASRAALLETKERLSASALEKTSASDASSACMLSGAPDEAEAQSCCSSGRERKGGSSSQSAWSPHCASSRLSSAARVGSSSLASAELRQCRFGQPGRPQPLVSCAK